MKLNQEQTNALWTIAWRLKQNPSYQNQQALKEVYRLLDYKLLRKIDGPPDPSYKSMRAFYGNPGNEKNLTAFTFPYPMRLAWNFDTIVTESRCHKKIVKPLLGALGQIEKQFDLIEIRRMGLDLYGGIYNNRSVRGGTSKSKHAWGAAIDLNPYENGLNTPWHPDRFHLPGYAKMPLVIIEIFESFGFLSGARAWGRDAMHFQYTK